MGSGNPFRCFLGSGSLLSIKAGACDKWYLVCTDLPYCPSNKAGDFTLMELTSLTVPASLLLHLPGLPHCLSFFSVAVTEYRDSSNLQKKAFSLGTHASRRLEFLLVMAGTVATGRQAWQGSSR